MVTFFPRSNKLTVPPLENGDRLSRSQFEQRYAAMPELKKAELIEGSTYVASPLRFEPHAEPHADLQGWLWTYKVATPGVRLGDNPTVRLDRDNEPQPDMVLRLDESLGGQSRIDEDGYIAGAPELIAEIAASTATIDLGDKLRAYRRAGVREYVVWQVCDRKIDWFYLNEGDYTPLATDSNDVVKSLIFPGLWLDRQAAIVGNMPQVMAVLQDGLKNVEHEKFVAKLTQA
ncbi:MAG: Uma2 family endonuclease [Cyanobacteria bacterium P01_F01_bin.33]